MTLKSALKTYYLFNNKGVRNKWDEAYELIKQYDQKEVEHEANKLWMKHYEKIVYPTKEDRDRRDASRFACNCSEVCFADKRKRFNNFMKAKGYRKGLES